MKTYYYDQYFICLTRLSHFIDLERLELKRMDVFTLLSQVKHSKTFLILLRYPPCLLTTGVVKKENYRYGKLLGRGNSLPLWTLFKDWLSYTFFIVYS